MPEMNRGAPNPLFMAALLGGAATGAVLAVTAAGDPGAGWLVNSIVDAIPVLPYDVGTAAAHATLLAAVRAQGRPRGAHDLMIAATALATRRSIVSADKSAFDDLPGVVVVDHRA